MKAFQKPLPGSLRESTSTPTATQAPRRQSVQYPKPSPSTTVNKDASQYLSDPFYGSSGPPIRMEATSAWMGVKPPPLTSACSGLRMVAWVAMVLLLVGAAVGLSVTMAIVHKNRDDDNGSGGGGGHGGGGSTGGGGNSPSQPGDLGPPPFTPPMGWTAIWWDEFSGDSVDQNKWNFDLGNGNWGWGNNESQYYTNDEANVRVANGTLAITALNSSGGSLTSGRLNSLGNAEFYPSMKAGNATYGAVHIEARIQLPTPGQGLWPAFWMYPQSLTYGNWPASGEIDIMESINAMDTITQGLHYAGPYPAYSQMQMHTTQQAGLTPWSNDFHTYGIEWTANSITFYVDGNQVFQMWSMSVDPSNGWYTMKPGGTPNNGTGPNAPFDEPFYIIMNLAVGGLFPGNDPITATFPATMLVDYVRAWAQ